MANIFVKYPHSYNNNSSKAELSALVTRETLEAAIAQLPQEKQSRIYAGEKFVIRVRAGSRTRLLKWRWEKPTSPYTTQNAPEYRI
jgi:hypothetical protein